MLLEELGSIFLFEKYSEQMKTLTQNDRKRIESLLKKLDSEYAGADVDYRDVLRYMLENNCKLEQEAVCPDEWN